MYGTIIFLSISIIILSVMLVIDIDIKFDFNNLIIPIAVKIFGIKIISLNISIFSLKYTINNGKKHKLLQVIGEEEKYIISQIKSTILDKLYYDRVMIDFKLGIGDADKIALVVGLSENILRAIKCLVANSNDLDFEYSIKANFENKATNLNLNIRVLFTIFDMVFGIILSMYHRGKYAKQKK